MSSALIRIVGGLSLGLLVVFAVLVGGHVTSHADSVSVAHADRLTSPSLLKKFDAAISAEALCHDKAPKKRHCRHAGRATAVVIEPANKRKSGKLASIEMSRSDLSSATLATGARSDELHLRLSYGAVYAATRRMHI